MARTRPKRLQDYTEHAMTKIDETVPTIGYVPPAKRPGKKFVLVIDKGAPVDTAVNIERVALADPIGFLSAIMHGQPIEECVVDPKTGKVTRQWINANVDQRMYVAKYFADKLIPYMTRTRAQDVDGAKKGKGDEDEFAALLHRASQKRGEDG